MKESVDSVLRYLIWIVLNNKEGKHFSEKFLDIDKKNKNKFHKLILLNKLSPSLLKYLKDKNLLDLIDYAYFEIHQKEALRFQMQSLAIIKEVKVINEIFLSKGLSPIYLKGIAILKEYSDISLRPLADVDILFQKSEIFKAYQALYENNLIDRQRTQNLKKNDLEFFYKNSHHVSILTKNNILIELHHRVTAPRDFLHCPLTSDFLKTNESINFYGSKLNIPSLENIIINQLVHFSIQSRFNKLLRTLNDLNRIQMNYIDYIDWGKIISKYNDQKIKKGLCLSLEIINSNGILIRDFSDIKERFNKLFPTETITEEAQNKLFNQGEDLQYKNPYMKFHHRKDKFRAFYEAFFPNKAWIIYVYNIAEPNGTNLLLGYLKNFIKQLQKIIFLPSYLIQFLQIGRNKKYSNSLDFWLNDNS